MAELPLHECFRVLELAPGSPPAAVREAYRDLSRVWHPDRFAGNADLLARANARQQELNIAYQRLVRAFEAGELGCAGEVEPAEPDPDDRRQTAPADPTARTPGVSTAGLSAWVPRAGAWVRTHPRPAAAVAGGVLLLAVVLIGIVARSAGLVNAEDGSRLTATLVSAGGAHACAVAHAGVACWGQNDAGQVGSAPATAARAVAIPLSDSVTAVAAGLAHSCALLAGGAIHCWGGNFAGQLGDLSLDDRAAPAPVAGAARYRAVSALARHTCAITGSGALQCWGDDTDGQLGTGAPVAACRFDAARFYCSDRPETVSHARAWSTVSAGGGHTCGVDAAGFAYCWGSNRYGQLGAGTDETCTGPGGRQPCSRRPVRVEGLPSGMLAVSAGASHTCVLDRDGAAWCWGRNDYGQAGGEDSIHGPRRVGGDVAFRQLAAGGYHTCGVTHEGAVHCWGRDADGELRGLASARCGDARCAREPVRVQPRGVRYAAAGFGRTCVVQRDDAVRCWGDGDASLAVSTPAAAIARGGVRRALSEAAWLAGTLSRFITRNLVQPLRDVSG